MKTRISVIIFLLTAFLKSHQNNQCRKRFSIDIDLLSILVALTHYNSC